jgi:hypothetical protein
MGRPSTCQTEQSKIVLFSVALPLHFHIFYRDLYGAVVALADVIIGDIS